ncbi:extradiol dioxygenase [Enemella dayhoffiae]|uniref:Extradiol dioxygenase n=1 Tax=Enemella dayhoffiae TaxID=2016507 RepID=A0A255HBY0_9ACTN|nr:VOC family protein [Enemella dayhoffiae]OYO25157.1 extradiol dioxygenase [Enemella dayhoffiae]
MLAVHALIYSDDADATRAFLRDVLQWRSTDAGGGWLIFDGGRVEVSTHPTRSEHAGQTFATERHHEISLLTDDLSATTAELSGRGAVFQGEPVDRGFGITVQIEVPGADPILLYQPRYQPPFD